MSIATSQNEMTVVSRYVREQCGIVLDERKGYLVESRLGPLVEDEGLSGYAELCRKAGLDGTGRLRTMIVDAITTNETSFFRDTRPFHLLAHKVIPDAVEAARSRAGGGGF